MIYHCALACAVVAAAQWAATQPGRPPHRIDALTANDLISQRLAEALRRAEERTLREKTCFHARPPPKASSASAKNAGKSP